VVTLWDVSAIWPRDLEGARARARARADQVVRDEHWEAGLIPSPESHFRVDCTAWTIRLSGCMEAASGRASANRVMLGNVERRGASEPFWAPIWC
jgi:hypothetical protein